jgi:hypothetical protein
MREIPFDHGKDAYPLDYAALSGYHFVVKPPIVGLSPLITLTLMEPLKRDLGMGNIEVSPVYVRFHIN